MTKFLISCLLALSLSACTTTKYMFPDPPPSMEKMPDDMGKPCPKIPKLEDKKIKTLGQSQIALIYQYARCANGKKSVTELYNQTKEQLDKYKAYYEEFRKKEKKAKK